MDENRLEGTARDLGGKVQESVGRATGDAGTQAEGMANQVAGGAQDVSGGAQDVYGQAADAGRTGAGKLDRWVRSAIEAQPYKSALVAMGIGWLLGRMRRPM